VNKVIIDQLSIFLSEADQMETETAVARWSKTVSAFLSKAVGSAAATDFNSFVEDNPYDLLALRTGHLKGLIAAADAKQGSEFVPSVGSGSHAGDRQRPRLPHPND
jgi:hypothetical protein